MKFVIDESKWRCGSEGYYHRGHGSTGLLNEQGYMCCLGQIELQLGLKQEEILNLGEPIETNIENILTKLVIDEYEKYILNTELAYAAMEINDSVVFTHEERKERLTELFAKQGHELEFING